MDKIRLLVIGIGCLIVSPILLFRYIDGVPSLNELKELSGEVSWHVGSRSTKRDPSEYPVIKLHNSENLYKYLDWFPESEEIVNKIPSGETVTIWVDEKNDWVWQIKQKDEIVTSYSVISEAVKHNMRHHKYGAPFLFILGCYSLFMLRRKMAG